MELTVTGFGIAKDIFSAPEIEVTMDSGATVAALKTLLEGKYPTLAALKSYLVAVNCVYGTPATELKPGDEIALIPPVSGG
ncbi:MAG: MoaD/ThiS family protein [Taibaiella sp.]|nr:MoaD/ThiS family protein [Taibaiella sp.]